jgi:hypothetical protein
VQIATLGQKAQPVSKVNQKTKSEQKGPVWCVIEVRAFEI